MTVNLRGETAGVDDEAEGGTDEPVGRFASGTIPELPEESMITGWRITQRSY
jgi:hypothetical protein